MRFYRWSGRLTKDINQFVHEHHQDKSHIEVTDEIIRAFHTLRGKIRFDYIAAISNVSAAIEPGLKLLQQTPPWMHSALRALADLPHWWMVGPGHYKQNVQSQNLLVEETQKSTRRRIVTGHAWWQYSIWIAAKININNTMVISDQNQR